MLLVDDHPLFVEGLKNLLLSRGIEVTGTAGDGLEALEKARTTRPEVILMDIAMPRCNGVDAMRLIRRELPEIKIVIMTSFDDDENLFNAIKSGASGYLLKSLHPKELFSLLAELERGEIPLSGGLAARILHAVARDPDGVEPERKLSPRQKKVLGMVARGMTYKEVAAALNLRERTIKYHMERILELLHLENRTQLIAYAAQHGFDRAW